MRWIKKSIKLIAITVVGAPVLFLLCSFILTKITVEGKCSDPVQNKSIFLNSNGIHLDLILPLENVNDALLDHLVVKEDEKYLSFGWGERAFYLETPTWGDLTFYNACQALLWESSSLMHVTRYASKKNQWVEIKVSSGQLEKLNEYLCNSFTVNEAGEKALLDEPGYTPFDNFYASNESYSCLNTCNSWANEAFIAADLDACYWTPFDFGLMDLHQKNIVDQ